jgi:mRNA interferase RelE/StbE
MSDVQILQANTFSRAYKRLHRNQQADVDDAIAAIVANPSLGEAKKGDLAGILVYKFSCVGQFDALAGQIILVATQ